MSNVYDFESCKTILNNIADDNYSKFAILTPQKIILCGRFTKVNDYLCSNDYFNKDVLTKYSNIYSDFEIEEAIPCDFCNEITANTTLIDGYHLCDDCKKWYLSDLEEYQKEIKYHN